MQVLAQDTYRGYCYDNTLRLYCSVCFVGVMFLMLYVFSILLGGLSTLSQCEQGYLSSDGCDFSVLVHHLFSGTDEDLALGDPDTEQSLGPDGYAIRNYFIPVYDGSGSTSGLQIANEIVVDNEAPDYGLSTYNSRLTVLWSSLVDVTAETNIPNMAFNQRGIPAGAELTSDGPNDAQFAAQEETLVDIIDSAYADTCPYYAEATVVGSYSTPDWVSQQAYSDVYSDVAFACPTCTAVPNTGDSPSRVYFNGTLWMARYQDIPYGWCSDISCYAYPYGFINYKADWMNATARYLPDHDCPVGVSSISKSPNWAQDQTLLSMTLTNLLTNSMLDPWLHTYSIQGGYSHYGALFFDAQLVSSAQAFWMVLIGMMLMNGFWPMAVWRAGHERAFGLVEMMNTGSCIAVYVTCFLLRLRVT
jgi:hypothetical protein